MTERAFSATKSEPQKPCAEVVLNFLICWGQMPKAEYCQLTLLECANGHHTCNTRMRVHKTHTHKQKAHTHAYIHAHPHPHTQTHIHTGTHKLHAMAHKKTLILPATDTKRFPLHLPLPLPPCRRRPPPSPPQPASRSGHSTRSSSRRCPPSSPSPPGRPPATPTAPRRSTAARRPGTAVCWSTGWSWRGGGGGGAGGQPRSRSGTANGLMGLWAPRNVRVIVCERVTAHHPIWGGGYRRKREGECAANVPPGTPTADRWMHLSAISKLPPLLARA